MGNESVAKGWEEGALQCVLLCAGAGTRMLPETLHRPKALVEIAGRPLLDYVLDFWSPRVSEFICVIGERGDMIRAYMASKKVACRFVEQRELRGIAHAVSLCRGLIDERFVVHLGDCILRGQFHFPPCMEVGVGVWRSDNEADILQSYSVEIENDLITRVEEKPREAPNDLCGMGTYFFDQQVFSTIANTPPSELRGEQEITDVVANIITEGRPLSPVFFEGEYLNVTYPGDLARARHIPKEI